MPIIAAKAVAATGSFNCENVRFGSRRRAPPKDEASSQIRLIERSVKQITTNYKNVFYYLQRFNNKKAYRLLSGSVA